ncbi:MAG: NAD(P)H-hydrate dehydratase [Chlamydiales bacterium]
MKVVTPKEMSRIEKMAYDAGFSEELFMVQAGTGIAEVVVAYLKDHECGYHIVLLCGKGNNTGDAYVAGYLLLASGLTVTALQVTPIEESSSLCRKQYEMFVKQGGKVTEDKSVLYDAHLIVDGLFGTGFHGSLKEPFATVVQTANDMDVPIISVDIPSGLNGETGEVEGTAIKADVTVFLGLPKQGFFLQSGWNHVGVLREVNFGLPEEYISQAQESFVMLSGSDLSLPEVIPSRHKYQAGCVMGVGGSPGMPGAAILASLSALRMGAGIVKLLHPKGMEAELAGAPYELVRICYEEGQWGDAIETLKKADALFVGPGIGKEDSVVEFIRKIFQAIEVPIVIDADALYHIAHHDISLPSQAILTPHTGELARLLHLEKSERPSVELLEKCQAYAEQHQIILVLKGGPTFIFSPDCSTVVSPFGCPGLASAGTGDVLTGMIAALAAQGKSPHSAACLGVALHGLAGEFAEEDLTSYCMIAGDVIDYLPEAIDYIQAL